MKKILSLIVLVFAINTANAQLKYTADGKLLFGQVSLDNLECVTGWQGIGHYYTYNNNYGSQTWFKINLKEKNVRLSGNGGYIVFYGDSAYEDIYVKNVYTNSDARFKSNIKPLTNALLLTKQLKPMSYGWKATDANNPNKCSTQELGFLAQDLETLVPEAVTTDAEGNKLVNYNTIIPVLTGAIQELEAKVAELERRIQQLENK